MWLIESTSDKKLCGTSLLFFNSFKKSLFSVGLCSQTFQTVLGHWLWERELVLAGGWVNKTHNYSAVVLGFWCHFRKPWGVWEHPPKMAVLVDFACVCVCVCTAQGEVRLVPGSSLFYLISGNIPALEACDVEQLGHKSANTLWVQLWNRVPTVWPAAGLGSPQHVC